MVFDKAEYDMKYDEQNTVQIKLKLNTKTDKDILDKLATVNKQGYIKQLIRADLIGEDKK
jgi:hypothetical protein